MSFQLLAMFFRGSKSAPVAWYFTAVGLRKAQDLGAHQKGVYSRNKPSGMCNTHTFSPHDLNLSPQAEEELWKRAFWLLVAFDRVGSATLGRPCGIGDEE
jgi:hypothetical protein